MNLVSKLITLLLISIASIKISNAQTINEFMDLQIHTTMHLQYKFFGKGLTFFDSLKPPKLSYKHLLTNVNYANYLKHNSGSRIVVNGAINSEYVLSRKKARKKIVNQINYINDFTNQNSNDFVVANTPQDVRKYVTNTSKTIFIHSIEGGRRLIKSQEDANFWASQGIAFITLVHLRDGEYGGAATLPSFITKLINLRGKKSQGLTDLGKQTIVWLANAGILIDVTHMNDRTRRDALDVMEAHHIPPLSTHEAFKPIQNHARALSEDDVTKIYKNGGLVSLPISGYTCKPYNPNPIYQKQIDSLNWYCTNSVDAYLFTYLAVKNYIQKLANLGYSDTLSEAQKINYSIGFQSDFNGWLNHSKPRVGKNGCFEELPSSDYETIEKTGLVHPGLLNSQWNYFEKKGADIAPIKRASEKFIQMWQYVLENKGGF